MTDYNYYGASALVDDALKAVTPSPDFTVDSILDQNGNDITAGVTVTFAATDTAGVYKCKVVSTTFYEHLIAHVTSSDADYGSSTFGLQLAETDRQLMLSTTIIAAITAQTTALQGADSDTLETLSDQMDGIATWTATSISSSVTAGSITQIKGNTWNFDIEDLTLDSNKIQFAIKKSKNNTDAESIIMIDTDTGLLYVNGEAATAGDGSLSYAGTTLTVVVDETVTDDLAESASLYYGIQSITAGGVVTEAYGGTFVITNDTVKAVS